VKEESGAKSNQSGRSVNPGVVLAPNHAPDSNERVAEAADPSGELELRARRTLFGADVVHFRLRPGGI
jgi:hypothetical protein